MSLDFSLRVMKMSEVYSGNYTHNVSPMWKLAGIYDDLYNSDGKRAKDILKGLLRGYKKMRLNQAKFEKLNPENGWGDYPTALKYLGDIISACEENPDSIIDISK